MRALRLLGRGLLTALLLILVLVVGFYSLYAGLFALDGSNGGIALGCLAARIGGISLLGWAILRLWRRDKRSIGHARYQR